MKRVVTCLLAWLYCIYGESNELDSLTPLSPVELTTTTIEQKNEQILFTGNKEAIDDTLSDNNYTNFHINCFDVHRTCFKWSTQGECDKNPLYMHEKCAYSCGTCSKQSMKFRYDNCHNSWEEDKNNSISDCYNWAKEGYCETDTFMHLYCRRSCNFCSFDSRCKPEIYRESGLDLNDYPNPNLYFRLFFNKILSNKYIVWKYNISLVNLDPPVLYFDNLIPETIADEFIIENQNEYYKRSVDVIGSNDDGSVVMSESEGRTSRNAWCGYNCQKNNSTQTVLESFEEITGFNRENYEDLQMLIYNKSDYYHYHHDFIESQAEGLAGGRILTFFLYLNNVEKGGETKFPQLKLKVKPKKGSAVLWPNVINNDMTISEPKTHHTALPVIKGVKYGVNAWVHLYSWVKAQNIDCTS